MGWRGARRELKKGTADANFREEKRMGLDWGGGRVEDVSDMLYNSI